MTSAERSRIMRAVKGRDTVPEMLVRRIVSSMGFRFRLHRKDIPGRPDLAFPGMRAVVFVNGCFWHGHRCKRGARVPETNRAYWTGKIARNKARDTATLRRLKADGWRVLVLWECELREIDWARSRLARFLSGEKRTVARGTGFEGSMEGAIAYASASPEGKPLAAVLEAVKGEVAALSVKVSGDWHRAELSLADGKRAAVRATMARRSQGGASMIVRFKPPRDAARYEMLYFGGISATGRAVVHKFKPKEIGSRQTLTLACGTA